MRELFLRILLAAALATLVLGPLLLGRRWLVKRYAPQTRLLAWLGVAAVLLAAPLLPRSLTPIQVEAPVRAVEWPVAAPAQVQTAVPPAEGETVHLNTTVVSPANGTVRPAPAQAAPAAPLDWAELGGLVWLTGAVAIGAAQVCRYALLRRRMMMASRYLSMEGGAQVRVLPGLDSPMTVGVLHTVVFLPRAACDPMALGHELAHIRRHDLWSKGFLFLVCALYWFHPLVWAMARAAGRDMEAACDADVTKGLDAGEKADYGRLLLAAAVEGHAPSFATRFGESKEGMKDRLTQLFRPGKVSGWMVAGILLAAAVCVGLVGCESTVQEPADGVYRASVSIFDSLLKDETGELDCTQIKLELYPYDPETGEVKEAVGTYTLPIAQGVALAGDQEVRAESHVETEPGSDAWDRSISTFLSWPTWRSQFYPDAADYLKVEVKDRQVVSMEWIQGPGGVAYTSGYGFRVWLPRSWEGQYRAEESGGMVTFYQMGQKEDQQRVLMSLVTAPREDFHALYGDKDLEGIYENGGPWIKVLHEGEDVVYAHIDASALPETPGDEGEERYLTMVRDAMEQLGPEDVTRSETETLYTSQYGFTLQLPESWAGKYTVHEGEGVVSFDRLADQRLLCQVLIDPVSILELYRTEEDPSGYAGVTSEDTSVVCETDEWLYRFRVPLDDENEPEDYRAMVQEARALGEPGVGTFTFPGWIKQPPRRMNASVKVGTAWTAEPGAADGETDTRFIEWTRTAPMTVEEALAYIEIEGFAPQTPFEDLPQELRDSLKRGEPEDLTGEGKGLWTTYTGEGIQVVTTQVNPEAEDGWWTERDIGKEFLSGVIVSGDGYATRKGLKVGDTLERCRELGYYLYEQEKEEFPGDSKGFAIGLSPNEEGALYGYRNVGVGYLMVTVEEGRIASLVYNDGLRWVGESFY